MLEARCQSLITSTSSLSDDLAHGPSNHVALTSMEQYQNNSNFVLNISHSRHFVKSQTTELRHQFDLPFVSPATIRPEGLELTHC